MIERAAALAATIAVAVVWSDAVGEAHKPITSPYTFAEHAGPIFRARCGSCHAPGQVAPMSLLTHEEAMPWAESIRLELMAGHMPPWGIVSPAGRFRGSTLTASELNTLLVWAAGGTPPGTAAGLPVEQAVVDWRLGIPDAVLEANDGYTMPAAVQEHTEVFTLPTNFGQQRLLRAIDLKPGAPSIVRSATISVAGDEGASTANVGAEKLLALWLPGGEPTVLDAGAGFVLPAGASLTLRVRYRKTWRIERDEIRDRSSVALYFAQGSATPVQALPLMPATGTASPASVTYRVERDFSLIGLHADPSMDGVAVTVHARRRDGVRERLFAVQPRQGWPRRYWLRQEMLLPRGTVLDVSFAHDDEAALLPPGMTVRPEPDVKPVLRVTLNGVVR
jgi:hypothetical protein